MIESARGVLGDKLADELLALIREKSKDRTVKLTMGPGASYGEKAVERKVGKARVKGIFDQSLSESVLACLVDGKQKQIVADAFYSPLEVAGLLGCSVDTVWRWCRGDKIKSARPGGKKLLIRGRDLPELGS